MTLRKGWLNRQFARVESDVQKWPASMQREAAFSVGAQALAPQQSGSPAHSKVQVVPQEAPAKKES
jgi:hypothetical protein